MLGAGGRGGSVAVAPPQGFALGVLEDPSAVLGEPSPPSKRASRPADDDVSREHPLFQAVHRNDLNSAKRAFKLYGKSVVTDLLASEACRHDRPLHRAVRCGWEGIVRYLVHEVKVPVNATKPDGATALFLAAQEGHTRLVELLLDAGANIDLPDEDGITPLYIACYQGHHRVVDALLRRGADPNRLGLDGTSPTFIAAQEGYAPIVRSLAINGASIDLLDEEGTAPLLMAAQEGRVAAVSVLLALGAEPNAPTPRGVRPLHSAAQNGHLRIVQLLMAYGADATLATQNGVTATKLASDFVRVDVAEWLAKAALWPRLRMCAEAELHWVAAALFSSGVADRLDGGVVNAVALCRSATCGAPMSVVAGRGGSGLRRASAPASLRCRSTASVFCAALQPWRPRNHRLFGPIFRAKVMVLLLVHHRLSTQQGDRKGQGQHGQQQQQARGTVALASAPPLLPVEMWLSIISHMPRRCEDGALSAGGAGGAGVVRHRRVSLI